MRKGGWVYCLDQPGQLLETLLTDLKSLPRSMPTGDVMCMAEMATLTHDRPLPVSCSHCNYCEHVMQKKILLKSGEVAFKVQMGKKLQPFSADFTRCVCCFHLNHMDKCVYSVCKSFTVMMLSRVKPEFSVPSSASSFSTISTLQ